LQQGKSRAMLRRLSSTVKRTDSLVNNKYFKVTDKLQI
jgi:hypothetical protein